MNAILIATERIRYIKYNKIQAVLCCLSSIRFPAAYWNIAFNFLYKIHSKLSKLGFNNLNAPNGNKVMSQIMTIARRSTCSIKEKTLAEGVICHSEKYQTQISAATRIIKPFMFCHEQVMGHVIYTNEDLCKMTPYVYTINHVFNVHNVYR